MLLAYIAAASFVNLARYERTSHALTLHALAASPMEIRSNKAFEPKGVYDARRS